MTNKTLSSKVAGPYASALIDIAISTHTVDFVTADVNELLTLFRENSELVNYLTNPLIPKKTKKAILEEVVEPMFLNQNTKRFLMVLLERSRIEMFSSIGDQFLQKVYYIAEIKLVQITSAIPLTSEQEENIIANLKARTGAKEIKLVSSIDKSILGGLKAQIGSNVIDGSLKSQLIKLATDLETKLF